MPQLLTLNGWRVDFDRETFRLFTSDMDDNSALKQLRSDKPDWFFHWSHGVVYGLPLVPRPSSWGKPLMLRTDDHLGLQFLAARLVPEFSRILKRDSFKHRPFTFLGKQDAVADFADRLKLPPLAREFYIYKKFALDAKLFEFVNDETFVGVILERKTSWKCTAELSELQKAGVDLSGLCVVRRQTERGQRRLVGRIDELSSGRIQFAESYDQESHIEADQVWLEGNLQSFSRCLKRILGPRHQDFERAVKEWEAENLPAPQFDALLERVGKKLSNQPVDLGVITARIGERLTASNSAEYRSIVNADKIDCCFNASKTQRDDFPWRGLNQFGPFSRETFPHRSARIWVFCPDSSERAVDTFIRHLKDGIVLPDYNGRPQTSSYPKGFSALFNMVNPTFETKRVGTFNHLRSDIAKNYIQAIEDSLTAETNPEVAVAIVVVPDMPVNVAAADNAYLQAKSLLLMAGIPVQEVRLPTVEKKPYELQYALRNIALALYAKMGGTPWTIANDASVHDELVIGMGTIEVGESRFAKKQRFVGITTVFSGEGNYLLGNVAESCTYDKYPEVLRESTLRILQEIKTRNGWQKDDIIRIIFHAKKPMRNVDVGNIIASCIQEMQSEYDIQFAFLNLVEGHPFYLFDPNQGGVWEKKTRTSKGKLVPERGTICQLGRFSRLVCSQGPRLMRHDAAPQPWMVHLHPASTFKDLDYLALQVLKFSAMSWRSTNPAPEPVSIFYSELIAKLLSRLKTVEHWSPKMLNLKLRPSRWFL